MNTSHNSKLNAISLIKETPKRIKCACGCGKAFRPKKWWQKFYTRACRQRAYNQRIAHKLRLANELLQQMEKRG